MASTVCQSTLNHIPVLAYGKTPSRSPKAENFLAIIGIVGALLEVYDVSLQALSHQHQRKCQAFLKYEAEANQRRKATAFLNKIRRRKLKDRKTSMGSSPPEVSYFL